MVRKPAVPLLLDRYRAERRRMPVHQRDIDQSFSREARGSRCTPARIDWSLATFWASYFAAYLLLAYCLIWRPHQSKQCLNFSGR